MKFINGFKWICLCIAMSGLANADLILDNKVVITDITGIAISPSNGNIMISTVSKDYVVTHATNPDPDPDPSGDVVINNLIASPASIFVSQSTNISWSTANADSCAATGGTGGWAGSVITLPSASKSITIDAIGNYTFYLTCEGTNGPVTESITVNVVEEPVVDPSANCGTPELFGTVSSWTGFWGTAFPLPTYSHEYLSIPRGGYHAIQFNTGDIVDHGGIVTTATTLSDGIRTGSISACEGEFDVEEQCKHIWGSQGGIGWATDGFNPTSYCQLEPNTTYYVNITFTDGFNPATDDCGSNESCVTKLGHFNLD